MTTIANLRARFTADTTGFEKGIGSVSKGISTLSSGLVGLVGGAVGAVGLGALVKHSLDAADAMQKLRDSTGLSSTFLTSMGQATRLAGADINLLARSSVALQKRATEAAEGNKTYAESFERLGLSAEAFNKLSPDDQIRTFSEAYSKLGSQAERNIVLTTLMGNRAVKLGQFFQLGAAGIAKAEAAARSANQVMTDDMVDSAAMVNDKWQMITDSIQGFIRNGILAYTDQMISFIEIVEDVMRNLGAIPRLFAGVGNAIGGVIAAAVQLASGNFSGAAEIWQNINADSDERFAGRDPNATRASAAVPNAAEQRQVELLERQNQILENTWVTLRKNNRPVAE